MIAPTNTLLALFPFASDKSVVNAEAIREFLKGNAIGHGLTSQTSTLIGTIKQYYKHEQKLKTQFAHKVWDVAGQFHCEILNKLHEVGVIPTEEQSEEDVKETKIIHLEILEECITELRELTALVDSIRTLYPAKGRDHDDCIKLKKQINSTIQLLSSESEKLRTEADAFAKELLQLRERTLAGKLAAIEKSNSHFEFQLSQLMKLKHSSIKVTSEEERLKPELALSFWNLYAFINDASLEILSSDLRAEPCKTEARYERLQSVVEHNKMIIVCLTSAAELYSKDIDKRTCREQLKVYQDEVKTLEASMSSYVALKLKQFPAKPALKTIKSKPVYSFKKTRPRAASSQVTPSVSSKMKPAKPTRMKAKGAIKTEPKHDERPYYVPAIANSLPASKKRVKAEPFSVSSKVKQHKKMAQAKIESEDTLPHYVPDFESSVWQQEDKDKKTAKIARFARVGAKRKAETEVPIGEPKAKVRRSSVVGNAEKVSFDVQGLGKKGDSASLPTASQSKAQRNSIRQELYRSMDLVLTNQVFNDKTDYDIYPLIGLIFNGLMEGGATKKERGQTAVMFRKYAKMFDEKAKLEYVKWREMRTNAYYDLQQKTKDINELVGERSFKEEALIWIQYYWRNKVKENVKQLEKAESYIQLAYRLSNTAYEIDEAGEKLKWEYHKKLNKCRYFTEMKIKNEMHYELEDMQIFDWESVGKAKAESEARLILAQRNEAYLPDVEDVIQQSLSKAELAATIDNQYKELERKRKFVFETLDEKAGNRKAKPSYEHFEDELVDDFGEKVEDAYVSASKAVLKAARERQKKYKKSSYEFESPSKPPMNEKSLAVEEMPLPRTKRKFQLREDIVDWKFIAKRKSEEQP